MSAEASFPEPPSSTQSRKRRLSSPISHYRNRFVKLRLSQDQQGHTQSLPPTAPKLASPGPEAVATQLPALRPTADTRNPRQQEGCLPPPTYYFAKDSPTSKGSIESDHVEATDDEESRLAGGNCRDSESQRRIHRPKAESISSDRSEEAMTQSVHDWIEKVEQERKRQLSTENGHTQAPPPAPMFDNDTLADRASDMRSAELPTRQEEEILGSDSPYIETRQAPTQLGSTLIPERRPCQRALRTVLQTHAGPSQRSAAVESRETPETNRQSARAKTEGSCIEYCLPLPRHGATSLPDKREPSSDVAICDSLSISSAGTQSTLEYTISDAILDLHQQMGKPFWTNDERWLVSVVKPASRSLVFTPFSDELIKIVTKLIRITERIKEKEKDHERLRFALAMRTQIGKLIGQIRDAVDTIWQHLCPERKGRKRATDINACEETIHRMRKFAIPRLVSVIGKIFTLLRNQAPEMREIVICTIGDISFDAERIGQIIRANVGKSQDDSSEDKMVEEFMSSLDVVRKWAVSNERARRAVRTIAV